MIYYVLSNVRSVLINGLDNQICVGTMRCEYLDPANDQETVICGGARKYRITSSYTTWEDGKDLCRDSYGAYLTADTQEKYDDMESIRSKTKE